MKEFIQRKCEEALLKMDLQLFAEDGEGGAGGSGEDGTPPDGEGAISFQSQSEFDSAVDKVVSKALETARSRWEKENEKKLKEAEQRGQMTAEEQAQFDLQQQREQLESERRSLQRDRDEAATIKRLAADKLPDSLSAVMAPLFGGEEAVLEEAYTAISKTFREAVEIGVNERLAKSAEPPAGSGGGSGSSAEGSLGKRLGQQNVAGQGQSKFFKN